MPDELGLSFDPVSFLITQLILQAVRALLELNHSLCKKFQRVFRVWHLFRQDSVFDWSEFFEFLLDCFLIG